jgi:CHASE2 domain-containing sensor protein
MRTKIFFVRPNPSACAKRPGETTAYASCENEKENAMRRTLIRYKTKPEMADKNAELVAAVFAELKAAKPDGTRYLTLRLEDNTFIHLVESTAEDGSSPIPKLAAFQAFQSGIKERCVEPPLPNGATIVGNYRMLDET